MSLIIKVDGSDKVKADTKDGGFAISDYKIKNNKLCVEGEIDFEVEYKSLATKLSLEEVHTTDNGRMEFKGECDLPDFNLDGMNADELYSFLYGVEDDEFIDQISRRIYDILSRDINLLDASELKSDPNKFYILTYYNNDHYDEHNMDVHLFATKQEAFNRMSSEYRKRVKEICYENTITGSFGNGLPTISSDEAEIAYQEREREYWSIGEYDIQNLGALAQ